MSGYSAKHVANYFLAKYGKHGISPLKIQKLVYLAHGWYMAFYDDPLIDDEYAEAWEYGPVFPSLYHEFKHFGRSPITELATEIDSEFNEATPRIPREDKKTRGLLDKTWEVYGNFTGMQLSRICHKPGSPWSDAKNDPEWRKNFHIDDDDIRRYYKKLRRKNAEKRAAAND